MTPPHLKTSNRRILSNRLLTRELALTNTADIARVLTETLVRLACPGWLADTFHGGAVGQTHLGRAGGTWGGVGVIFIVITVSYPHSQGPLMVGF